MMAEEPVNARSTTAPTPPPLEVFPSYPCFWKPSQISGCWRVVGDRFQHNKPQDRTEKLFEANNGEIVIVASPQNFVQDFDFEAIKHQILGQTNNWEDALNEHDPALGSSTSKSDPKTSRFSYITTSYTKGKIQSSLETILRLPKLPEKQTELKKKKIQDERNQLLKNHNSRLSNLLIYARHKLVHTVDLPPDGLSALGFLTVDSTGENSKGFVQILINAFPKLVPFVGIKKGNFSINTNSGIHKDKFRFDIKRFLDQLKCAFDYNMMTGGLEKSYQDELSAGSVILEFRKPNQFLEFHGDTTALAAIIGKDNMKIIWNDIQDVDLTYTFSDNTSLENTCIIFSKTGCKVNQLLEHCTGKKIIIVDDRDTNLSDIVNTVSKKYNCKLVEVEVNWKDIRGCKAENFALSRNVSFHKVNVPIGQILSDQKFSTFVEELKGEELNKLLRSEDFQIFDIYEKPSQLNFYIEREFLEKVVIQSHTLTRNMQIVNDVFVICGIEYKDAKGWFPGNQVPLIIEKGKRDWLKFRGLDELSNRIVLIEDLVESLANIFEIIGEKNWFQTYNIHCFKHKEQDALSWIGSKGDDSILNEFRSICLTTNQCKHSEDSLVDAIPENIRAIILSGVPGSGKSEAMNKIANDMFAKYEGSIVAVIKIEQFVAKLRDILANDELCIGTVVNTLAELGSDSCFKKQIAKIVLLSSQADAKVKVELMFDGLDETTSESRGLLIKTVKYIIEHMPMVRTWISIRDHLVHETEKLPQTVHVTMMPFTKKQQIDFVFEKMHEYIQENSPSKSQVVPDDKLQAFAEACTNIKLSKETIDIAGIPLHCYLISQFYAEKALQNDFSIDENRPTLYQLYKNIFYQKFLIYHRKNGVNLQKSHLKLAIYGEPFDRMMHRHIYLALRLLYSEECADWFQQKMCLNIKDLNKLASLVLPYGLIESLEPMRFLHLTFAEYLVGVFIGQVITKQLENEISTTDTKFLELAWNNTLCIDTTRGKYFPVIKKPSIAYFFDASLAKAMDDDDCKIVNDEMVDIIFSMIPPSYIRDKNKEEVENFKKLFDVKVAPCFPLQNLFILQHQNRQFEYCKQVILLGKRHVLKVFPLIYRWNKLEIIEMAYTSKDLTLFEIRPKLSREAFINSKILSENDNWLEQLHRHVGQLLFTGNLVDNSLLKWVKFLLLELKNIENERKQADKNVYAEDSLLSYAIHNKTSNSNSIEYLCKLGIDVNMPDFLGRTPLMEAAKNGRIDLVETLLTEGADISLKDKEGNSVDLIQYLLQERSTLFNERGLSIQRRTLASGSVPLAKSLLPEFPHLISEYSTEFIEQCAMNLNVRFSNKYGETPLHFSLSNSPDQIEATVALLNAEADIYAVNWFGKCPIYTSLIHCNLEVMIEIVRLEPLYSNGRECTCKLHTFIRKKHTRLNKIRRKKMRRFVKRDASRLPGEIYIRFYDYVLLYYVLLYLLIKMVTTQKPDEAFGFLYLLASLDLGRYLHHHPFCKTRNNTDKYYIHLLNLIEPPDENKQKLTKYIENRMY